MSKGSIVNAVLVFLTALVAIPGVLKSKDHRFLRAHSLLLVVCGTVSLVVGLIIWFETLQTRSMLGAIYAHQTQTMQSSIQQEVCLAPLAGDTRC